jgi:fucose permease
LRPSSSIQVAWIHLAFVLTGVLTTLLGPILPELSLRLSLSDSQAGAFFTTQFIGSSIGVLVSSLLTVRRGFRITLGTGLGMMAVGAALLGSLGSWMAAAGSVFCYGIGLGLVIPAGNVWIAAANPTRRGSALNLLNLSWGIGAVACPFLVALAQRATELPELLLGLAGLLLLLAFPASSRSFGLLEVPPEQKESLEP